jgi:pantoate--beta-alanine ligase
LLKKAGADYVFAPSVDEMYPDHFEFSVHEKNISKILDGEHRPGHFEGMLTVVLKLLNISRASHAYFGEKDFQQLELVKSMAAAFFLKTHIVGCPTIRTEQGLALSSRNQRLSTEDLEKANHFPRILKKSLGISAIRQELSSEGFEVDYVESWKGRKLAAVRIGEVRLIDNMEMGASV